MVIREAISDALSVEVDLPQSEAVLPDGLDQLPSREVLFTVILTTISRVEVCNNIIDLAASHRLPI
jgi:hypothetical protein